LKCFAANRKYHFSTPRNVQCSIYIFVSAFVRLYIFIELDLFRPAGSRVCENFAQSRASRMLPPPPMMMMGPQPAPRQNTHTHTLDHQFVWLIKSAFLIRLCGDANYGRVEIESVPLRQLAVRPSARPLSSLSSSALFAAAALY
jgi:hypothetical protein